MGGRGASAGLRGGGGGGGGLGAMFGNAGQPQQQPPQNQPQQQQPKRGQKVSDHDLIAEYSPGFDDNGNPQVTKWQQQADENKAARFLSKVNDDYTYRNGKFVDSNGNVISDKYGFYDGEYQKFTMALGLNAKPQVMDDKAFDAMVAKNNLQLLYRGESGQNAADRFYDADISHTGVGNYGDGSYFSTRKSDAIGYAQEKSHYSGTGKVETMVLSPTAHAIKYSELHKIYNSLSPRLRSALDKAGSSAYNSGYGNKGEAQLALRLGYNVVACDDWGRTYCYALDRSAFIVRRSLETY